MPEPRQKRKFNRISVYFYIASLMFLFSVIVLTVSGFRVPLDERLGFLVVAFILLMFGLIMLATVFRIARAQQKQVT